MKKVLLAAALALTTAIGSAQTTQVTMTNVLAVQNATDTPVYSGTYDPASDKYLIGHAGSIDIFNGVTGASEGNLDITGITPSDLGFFAMTASKDGYIYVHEFGGNDIWRWNSVSGTTATKVYDNVAGLQRGAANATTEDGVLVAFTGSADDGPVEFFSDSFSFATESFPFASDSFTFKESVDLDSKSALALSSDGDTVFTVGTTGERTILKWINVGGTWTADPLWPAPQPNPATEEPIAAGAFAYDDANEVLFVHDMRSTNNSLKAYDGITGDVIGEAELPIPSATLSGYHGAYVEPGVDSGTLWVACRGSGANTNATLYKWTYTITESSEIGDWSLYKE